MKVLHLIYTHGVAGAEKYLQHLLPPLHQYNIESHLILVSPKEYTDKLAAYCLNMTEKGIPVTVITGNKSSFIKTAKKIDSYTRQHNITYLHSHLINSDVLAILVKKFYNRNITLISTKHGYNEKILQQVTDVNKLGGLRYRAMCKPYYFISWLTLRFIKHNFAVSKAMAKFFNTMGFTKKVMPFIHHGVTIPVNKDAVEQTAAHPLLLIIGRLEAYKGHEYLFRAMPEVLKHFPLCKLMILGEGSERKNYEALIETLDIKNNVVFMGFSNHPYTYIKAANVVVIPSLFEPFGLVFIEAIALAKPVVAFDVPAGNEILKDGVTGVLVPRADSNRLAQKIIELLNNTNMCNRLGTAAYQHYCGNFTTAVMVKNTAGYYKFLAEVK